MIRRILMAGFLVAFVCVAVVCPSRLFAQGTKLWLQANYDDFEKGRLQSASIDSNGYIEAGPKFQQIAVTPSTYVWALASDSSGNAYLATGSPATVLKISPTGTITKLFSSKDLSVQAVKAAPDGTVYAATLPSGKVYRIGPKQTNLDESSASVVFDPSAAPTAGKADSQTKYIWDLAFDAGGRLYVATGGPAAIYRVDVRAASAKPELFFSSDEQHLRCMLFEPDGDLLAGSDGAGLVYRIGKDGKGVVIYNAPKREITALAESSGGQIYVADVGEKSKSSLPPLAVQGGTGGGVVATITIVAPASVQASSGNSLVPEGSEIDELNAQGAPRKLWDSAKDVVYALRIDSRGLLAATGNRGTIYRIHEDGSYTDLARTSSGQVTAFAAGPGGIYAATSNIGRLFLLGTQPAADSTYVSDVFDSGLFSTWGRAEVNANDGGAAGPYELFTRSGNVENPERNWSPWQKVAPGASSIAAPPARFIQWKVVLQPGSRISSVGLNYLPVNVAPVVDEIVVQPGARVNAAALQMTQPQQISINLPSAQAGATYSQDASSQPLSAIKDRTAVTIRWAAHDDNGDELAYDLYFKGDGEKDWRLLRAHLSDTYYSFDSIRLPDGGYRLKVVASDAPSQPPGQALLGEKVSEHFVIDTTPPVITALTAAAGAQGVHVTFQAADAVSPIARAQYSLDGGAWLYVDPVGKLSDLQTEHYDFTIPLGNQARTDGNRQPQSDAAQAADAEHVLAVRAYDRYENVSAAKIVVH